MKNGHGTKWWILLLREGVIRIKGFDKLLQQGLRYSNRLATSRLSVCVHDYLAPYICHMELDWHKQVDSRSHMTHTV